MEFAMRLFIILLCAASSLILYSPSQVQADSCKGPLKVAGPVSGSEKQAFHLAVKKWQERAAELYGDAYGSWDRSKFRVINCTQIPTGAQSRNNACKLRARPCGSLYISPELGNALN